MPDPPPQAIVPVLRPAGPRASRSPPRSRPRQAALTIATLRLLGRLSLPGLHRLAGSLGHLLATLPSKPRTNTIESLRLAFPSLEGRAVEKLARRSLIEDFRMLLEHAAFWTWPPERALDLVSIVEGEELLTAALARGRGVILAGLHLGMIEALNACLAARFGLIGQYRAPRARELDGFMRRARERYGAELLDVGHASVRRLVKGLREGRLVGLACDQDPGAGQGIFVPFFGVATNTTTLIGRLASRTGAEVIVGWAERLPGSAGFSLHFVATPDEVKDADPAVSAAAMNRVIESCVRRRPEQWLWSYRRFRIRPPSAGVSLRVEAESPTAAGLPLSGTQEGPAP